MMPEENDPIDDVAARYRLLYPDAHVKVDRETRTVDVTYRVPMPLEMINIAFDIPVVAGSEKRERGRRWMIG